MSIAAAMAELQKSPALHDHIAFLQDFIAEEQRRREQFHRNLESQCGEFINGRIHIASLARKCELDAAKCVSFLLHGYVGRHQLGEVPIGRCLVHCQRNDYEPDICFFGVGKAANFMSNLLLFPPPDLAVEVLSPATEEHDRKLKWQDYARHGVGEYWIVDADEQMVEQYILPPGRTEYELEKRLAGRARLVSATLPGFDVPVAAFFDGAETQLAQRILFGT